MCACVCVSVCTERVLANVFREKAFADDDNGEVGGGFTRPYPLSTRGGRTRNNIAQRSRRVHTHTRMGSADGGVCIYIYISTQDI